VSAAGRHRLPREPQLVRDDHARSIGDLKCREWHAKFVLLVESRHREVLAVVE